MSYFLPQEKLAEIQHASDIVSIISDYVALKSTGKNHVGLCPFHNEKTPSFTVNSEKQFYKCFGCGEAGSVFTFLTKHNGIKFPEAVKIVAEKANIPLSDNFSDEKVSSNDFLSEINTFFAKFYYEKLTNSSAANHVRKYVAERGINEQFAKKFALGYSLSSWDSALIEAKTQQFEIETLEDAGMILKRKSGPGYYDRFRDRLMFPISSESGRVIGFGARALDDESQPKYLNSAESKIFNKRKILYGLNFAKHSIIKRHEAVIFEGYTDVIMAHQCGIDWSVAVMGTSLTTEHAKLIKRYCDQVVLVLDSDIAGIKSAEKSAGLLIENGLDVKIVQLPEKYDPCAYLVANGKDDFLNQIEKADDFFGFKMNIAGRSDDLSSVSGKTKVFKEIISTAMRIPDILKRNIQIKEIAEKINIDESELRKYVSSDKNSKTKTNNEQPGSVFIKQNLHGKENSSKLFPVTKGKSGSYKIETELLRLMIFDNKFISNIKSDIGLKNFFNEELKSICRTIFEISEKSGSFVCTELFANLKEPELHETLANIVSVDSTITNSENIFEECKQYIKKRVYKEEIKKAKELTMDMGDGTNDDTSDYNEKMKTLLEEFHKKNKELDFNKLDRRRRKRKMDMEMKENALV